MREVIKELAFHDNAMFDGNGYLKNFKLYIDDREDAGEEDMEEDADSDWMTIAFLKTLHENLRSAFSGSDASLSFPDRTYSDLFISVDISNGSICMKGYD